MKTQTIPTLSVESMESEVARAFADCHKVAPYADKGLSGNSNRNLNYRASLTCTRAQAAAFMDKYCNAYNNFASPLLAKLPEDSRVRIAREGSPALYVTTNTTPGDMAAIAEEMQADEFHLCVDEPGAPVYRLWWD